MKPTSYFRSLMCLILALSYSSAANAAVLVAVYSGIINFGSDNKGLFGEPGSIAGRSVVVTYVFDTSRGTYSTVPSRVETAGNNFSGQSPILSTSVAVSGVPYNLNTSQGFFGSVIQADIAGFIGYDQVAHFASVYRCFSTCDPNKNFGDDQVNAFVQSNVHNFANGLDISSPLDYDLLPGDRGGGFFQLGQTDPATTNFDFYATADFVFSHVSIQPIASNVPEPESWMMMLFGFGIVGTSSRIHKRRVHTSR